MRGIIQERFIEWYFYNSIIDIKEIAENPIYLISHLFSYNRNNQQ